MSKLRIVSNSDGGSKFSVNIGKILSLAGHDGIQICEDDRGVIHFRLENVENIARSLEQQPNQQPELQLQPQEAKALNVDNIDVNNLTFEIMKCIKNDYFALNTLCSLLVNDSQFLELLAKSHEEKHRGQESRSIMLGVPVIAATLIPIIVPILIEHLVPILIEQLIPLVIDKLIPLVVDKLAPLVVDKLVPLVVDKLSRQKKKSAPAVRFEDSIPSKSVAESNDRSDEELRRIIEQLIEQRLEKVGPRISESSGELISYRKFEGYGEFELLPLQSLEIDEFELVDRELTIKVILRSSCDVLVTLHVNDFQTSKCFSAQFPEELKFKADLGKFKDIETKLVISKIDEANSDLSVPIVDMMKRPELTVTQKSPIKAASLNRYEDNFNFGINQFISFANEDSSVGRESLRERFGQAIVLQTCQGFCGMNLNPFFISKKTVILFKSIIDATLLGDSTLLIGLIDAKYLTNTSKDLPDGSYIISRGGILSGISQFTDNNGLVDRKELSVGNPMLGKVTRGVKVLPTNPFSNFCINLYSCRVVFKVEQRSINMMITPGSEVVPAIILLGSGNLGSGGLSSKVLVDSWGLKYM